MSSRLFNLGHGSTWPGHIALALDKNFIQDIFSKNKTKIIVIAGTNGKTTTAKLTQTILTKGNRRVFRNKSGANLLNGVASGLIANANLLGKINTSYAIFEIDENVVPLFIQTVYPDYLIALNLFRDQLDRYGEVDTIAAKWKESFKSLPKSSTLILNADDPQIALLGENVKAKTYYFGLNNPDLSQQNQQHTADSVYCPKCAAKLNFKEIYFSHLGNWECENCSFKRPALDIDRSNCFPLPGVYNQYNVLAAVLLAKTLDIGDEVINQSLRLFKPAFGRQEIIEFNGKKIQIFLSKNPTSLNESLRTIVELGADNVLIVLNDRIPDGRDVSWIWDANFEDYIDKFKAVTISGDRCFDMGLRIKYSLNKFQLSTFKFQIEEDLKRAISLSLNQISKSETLYITPTYSAMLNVRKILTGRSIL